MDAQTQAVYETLAARWVSARKPNQTDAASELAGRSHGPTVDLGCGPGWHAGLLQPPVIALDGAMAMLELVRAHAPHAQSVQGDLEELPFRAGAFNAAWARNSYVHLARARVPMALADLHRSLTVGAQFAFLLFLGDDEGRNLFDGDDFPDRYFSRWDLDQLLDVVTGAGFEVDGYDVHGNTEMQIRLRLTRARTLPDLVAPEMGLLVCGLNPSLYAADARIGFARPGNRFWPAALAAGIASRDRDPRHALREHGVGFTDLVKRATVRADELSADEYRAGYARVERLVRWLRPGAVVFVGLAGWRVAIDRKARVGVQPDGIGGRPAYVMPSTSGLNARVPVGELTEHLREASMLGATTA